MSILNISHFERNGQLSNTDDFLATSAATGGSENPAKANLADYNHAGYAANYGVHAMPYINKARVVRLEIAGENWISYVNKDKIYNASGFGELNPNLLLIPNVKDDAKFLEIDTGTTQFFDSEAGKAVLGLASKAMKVVKAVEVGKDVIDGIKEGDVAGTLNNVAQTLATKLTFTSPYNPPVSDKPPTITYPVNSFDFNFKMGYVGLYDAFEEVVKPIIGLLCCFLPKGEKKNIITPIYPTSTQKALSIIKGLASKDSGLVASSSGDGATGIMNQIEDTIVNILSAASESLKPEENKPYATFKYGHQIFWKTGITKISASFNSNLTDDHGFPAEGILSMSFIPSVQFGYSGDTNYKIASQNYEDPSYFVAQAD